VAFAQVKDNPQQFLQTPVRWGGTIVERRKKGEFIQLEVLQRPLGEDGKPLPRGRSYGTFIARIPAADMPRQLEPGRLLTVYGPVSGTDHKTPVVLAETQHVWRTPRDMVMVHNGHHVIMKDRGLDPSTDWNRFLLRHCRHLHGFYYDCNI
jgi:starvation-inducible outer membrane lipoprotein